MLFVICSGVWAVILAITTISMFSLSAFGCAGKPPLMEWGSFPVVGKGHLENCTFCHYCSKPKSPRAHHCRSCGMCVLDIDHHCPFIGNCVGAANHGHFIAFLISAIISTVYVSVMSAYAALHIRPPLPRGSPYHFRGINSYLAWRTLKEIIYSVVNSAVSVSTRRLIIVYLFVSSISVEIGLSVLLGQQLYYIYEGKTYISI